MVKIFKIMKQFRMLIMLLIGMIGFTATATTAKLEQKQKTTFVKEFTPHTSVVSVVNDYQVTVFKEAVAKPSFTEVTQLFVIKNYLFKDLAIITDVGWRCESLSNNYNLHNTAKTKPCLKFPTNRKEIKIRNDC